MAISLMELGGGNVIVHDTDCDVAAGTVAENDVLAGPCELRAVKIDNSANAAADVVMFYDSREPTVNTTATRLVLQAEASGGVSGGDVFVDLVDEDGNGVEFATGLSFAGSTRVGWRAGTAADPASAMLVSLYARRI